MKRRTRRTIAARIIEAPTREEARDIARYGDPQPLVHKLATAYADAIRNNGRQDAAVAAEKLSSEFARIVCGHHSQDLRDLADFMDQSRRHKPDKIRAALLELPFMPHMSLEEFARRHGYKGSLQHLGRIAVKLVGRVFIGMHHPRN